MSDDNCPCGFPHETYGDICNKFKEYRVVSVSKEEWDKLDAWVDRTLTSLEEYVFEISILEAKIKQLEDWRSNDT